MSTILFPAPQFDYSFKNFLKQKMVHMNWITRKYMQIFQQIFIFCFLLFHFVFVVHFVLIEMQMHELFFYWFNIRWFSLFIKCSWIFPRLLNYHIFFYGLFHACWIFVDFSLSIKYLRIFPRLLNDHIFFRWLFHACWMFVDFSLSIKYLRIFPCWLNYNMFFCEYFLIDKEAWIFTY